MFAENLCYVIKFMLMLYWSIVSEPRSLNDHFGDSHDLPVQFRADAMSRN